jgi:hypothetical protein
MVNVKLPKVDPRAVSVRVTPISVTVIFVAPSLTTSTLPCRVP